MPDQPAPEPIPAVENFALSELADETGWGAYIMVRVTLDNGDQMTLKLTPTMAEKLAGHLIGRTEWMRRNE